MLKFIETICIFNYQGGENFSRWSRLSTLGYGTASLVAVLMQNHAFTTSVTKLTKMTGHVTTKPFHNVATAVCTIFTINGEGSMRGPGVLSWMDCREGEMPGNIDFSGK